MRATRTLLALLLAAVPAAARAPALLPGLRPLMGEVPGLGEVEVVRPPAFVVRRVFLLSPSDPARAAAERALLEAAEDLAASTQEGSRILNELRARGRPVTVSFVKKPGSVLSRSGAREEIEGVSGSFQKASGSIDLNELFLAMADSRHAALSAALTLVHEAEHVRLHAAVSAMTPWFSSVLTIDAANERNAFLSEFLVAAELGLPSGTLDSARVFAADGPAYWEKKRLGGALYALALSLDEMGDPVGAWRGRAAKLKAKLQETRDEVQADIPRARRALAHMRAAHALPVRHLEEEAQEDLEYLTGRLAVLEDSIDFLESRIAKFSDPVQGAAIRQELAFAAAHPGYRGVTDLVDAKTARLVAALPSVPAPPPAPSRGLTWKEFYDAVDQDRRDHPDHWDPRSREPLSLGPTWKVLVAELSTLPRG